VETRETRDGNAGTQTIDHDWCHLEINLDVVHFYTGKSRDISGNTMKSAGGFSSLLEKAFGDE